VFQQYSSGILDDTACGTEVDSGMTAVGYGKTEDGKQFFIIKNSWTDSWGDKGYIKIAAAPGAGICGINTQPVYPLM